jgi:hypothetical protein
MMRNDHAHLSDPELILAGERDTTARGHLLACARCQSRLRELEDSISEAVRVHRENAIPHLPPADGPRALLQARLSELAAIRREGWFPSAQHLSYVAAAVLCAIAFWQWTQPSEPYGIPRPDLTPGAVRPVAASDVCSAHLGDNVEVVPAVQRQVFTEYGMPNAEAKGYEVDYLITPALGGSDDLRNLWPQPYSGSAWNAYVKDALEDRLRTLVCAGQLDLATAQHEIAMNWIAAYKKYFHTNRPLAAHTRFRSSGEPE